MPVGGMLVGTVGLSENAVASPKTPFPRRDQSSGRLANPTSSPHSPKARYICAAEAASRGPAKSLWHMSGYCHLSTTGGEARSVFSPACPPSSRASSVSALRNKVRVELSHDPKQIEQLHLRRPAGSRLHVHRPAFETTADREVEGGDGAIGRLRMQKSVRVLLKRRASARGMGDVAAGRIATKMEDGLASETVKVGVNRHELERGLFFSVSATADGGDKQDDANETAKYPRPLHGIDFIVQTPFWSHALRTGLIQVGSVIARIVPPPT